MKARRVIAVGAIAVGLAACGAHGASPAVRYTRASGRVNAAAVDVRAYLAAHPGATLSDECAHSGAYVSSLRHFDAVASGLGVDVRALLAADRNVERDLSQCAGDFAGDFAEQTKAAGTLVAQLGVIQVTRTDGTIVSEPVSVLNVVGDCSETCPVQYDPSQSSDDFSGWTGTAPTSDMQSALGFSLTR